jgi:aspartate/methionine/tyrosine aminotransferase
MTGWRLGWLVVPNVSPATLKSWRRISSSRRRRQPRTLHWLPSRRPPSASSRSSAEEFQKSARLPGASTRESGLPPPSAAAGSLLSSTPTAQQLTSDSARFASELLESAGVAATPGVDFGSNLPEKYLRFAYTANVARLAEAVDRIRRFLGTGLTDRRRFRRCRCQHSKRSGSLPIDEPDAPVKTGARVSLAALARCHCDRPPRRRGKCTHEAA